MHNLLNKYLSYEHLLNEYLVKLFTQTHPISCKLKNAIKNNQKP